MALVQVSVMMTSRSRQLKSKTIVGMSRWLAKLRLPVKLLRSRNKVLTMRIKAKGEMVMEVRTMRTRRRSRKR